jgi:hypothetical protein
MLKQVTCFGECYLHIFSLALIDFDGYPWLCHLKAISMFKFAPIVNILKAARPWNWKHSAALTYQ